MYALIFVLIVLCIVLPICSLATVCSLRGRVTRLEAALEGKIATPEAALDLNAVPMVADLPEQEFLQEEALPMPHFVEAVLPPPVREQQENPQQENSRHENSPQESPQIDAFRAFAKRVNPWAAGGIVLLIAAFSFLIAYLAKQGLLSVEMGIVAALLSGIGMVIFGWRCRKNHKNYSLILQGGGIGIVYLAVFAAPSVIASFPALPTLLLMCVLIPPTVVLALAQNAQVLAIFGFLGGFLAPVFLDDGIPSGAASLIFFAYYLILDMGVFFIGHRRAWQQLKLLAFAATFGYTLIWVFREYQAGYFAVAASFSAGYILLFNVMSLLPKKTETEPQKILSATLSANSIDVFILLGVPLAGAAIEWKIFSSVAHGLPIVCIVFAAFYLALTVVVWKKFAAHKTLTESFLTFAVFLANLAIPLELSPFISSAIFSAEGALIFLFGVLNKNGKARAGALILHIAAAVFFVYETSRFTGGIIIAVSALAMAFMASKIPPKLPEQKPTRTAANLLAIWGFLWWFGSWAHFLADGDIFAAKFFLFAAASSLVFAVLSRVLSFAPYRWAAVPVWIIAIATTLVLFAEGIDDWHPHRLFAENAVANGYFVPWLAFFASEATLLVLERKIAPAKLHAARLLALILIAVFVLTNTARSYTVNAGLSPSWTSLAGIAPLLCLVGLLSGKAKMLARLSAAHRTALFFLLPLALCSVLGIWFLVSLFFSGNPDPLPLYIPLLNPLELEQGFSIAAIVLWQLSAKRAEMRALSKAALFYLIDAMIFLMLTSLVGRTTHFYLSVPMSDIFESSAFHLGLFVLWLVFAIVHLYAGSKKAKRRVWIIGAVLIIAVIAKLIIIDLAAAGTIARIITFFLAGLALLFIGWAVPFPPAGAAKIDKAVKTALCIFAACCALGGTSRVYAEGKKSFKASDFSNTITLSVPQGSLAYFELPEYVYTGFARSDRGDLRLFDSEGAPVSFMRAHLPEKTVTPPPKNVPFFPWDSANTPKMGNSANANTGAGGIAIDARGTIITVTGGTPSAPTSAFVLDMGAFSPRPSSLSVEVGNPDDDDSTPMVQSITLPVTIFSSDDFANWQPFDKKQTIVRIAPELNKNSIEIPKKGRYLLLVFDKNSTPAVTAITAHFEPESAPKSFSTSFFQGELSADATRITYFVGGYLPARRVDFSLQKPDSVPVRIGVKFAPAEEWSYQTGGTIFLLESGRKNESFGVRTGAPYWLLEAKDGMRFTEIPALKVEWEPERIIFLVRQTQPHNEQFTLAYGNPNAAPASSADFDLNDEDVLAPASVVKIDRSEWNATPQMPFFKQQWFLWLILILSALTLCGFAFYIRKAMRADEAK